MELSRLRLHPSFNAMNDSNHAIQVRLVILRTIPCPQKTNIGFVRPMHLGFKVRQRDVVRTMHIYGTYVTRAKRDIREKASGSSHDYKNQFTTKPSRSQRLFVFFFMFFRKPRRKQRKSMKLLLF
jgi:hypothetical protein